jgi:hypothetical protein
MRDASGEDEGVAGCLGHGLQHCKAWHAAHSRWLSNHHCTTVLPFIAGHARSCAMSQASDRGVCRRASCWPRKPTGLLRQLVGVAVGIGISCS